LKVEPGVEEVKTKVEESEFVIDPGLEVIVVSGGGMI
jgi:hypothetical protein